MEDAEDLEKEIGVWTKEIEAKMEEIGVKIEEIEAIVEKIKEIKKKILVALAVGMGSIGILLIVVFAITPLPYVFLGGGGILFLSSLLLIMILRSP